MEVERSLADMLGRVPDHIETRLVVEPGTEVAPGYRWLVFRVAQEALRNVVQHSRARHVIIAMRHSDSGTVITIDDDGVGFSPEKDPIEPGHMGLSLLSDMATAAGGVVFIRSAPGKGTTIRLEVPE
jgi:signal transduction histidine kinase